MWRIAILALALPLATKAQLLGIGNATEVTQLLNHLELYNQYIRQGLQLEQAIKQTADMLKNSNRLNSWQYADLAGQLQQMASLVKYGKGLAYTMANFDQQFRTTFPGYGTYAGGNYYQNYRNWATVALDTPSGA